MFCGTLGTTETLLKHTEQGARLYLSTHMEIHFDEHKSNYTFFRFSQKCFLDPTMRFYSDIKNLRALTEA